MKQTQLTALAVIVVIVAAISALVLLRPNGLPPDYEVETPAATTTRMSAAEAANAAVDYLNRQTPQLAAPELHVSPRVTRVVATPANGVRAIEPAVSPVTAAAQGAQIVWVVLAQGDFLNLANLAWTSASAPAQDGSVVIDDATGTILGVYPHSIHGPGGTSRTSPPHAGPP